jgi:hypothetical protein
MNDSAGSECLVENNEDSGEENAKITKARGRKRIVSLLNQELGCTETNAFNKKSSQVQTTRNTRSRK